jgi:hypothetical protein
MRDLGGLEEVLGDLTLEIPWNSKAFFEGDSGFNVKLFTRGVVEFCDLRSYVGDRYSG